MLWLLFLVDFPIASSPNDSKSDSAVVMDDLIHLPEGVVSEKRSNIQTTLVQMI